MARITKKQSKPELIDLPEVEWMTPRYAGLKKRLVILCGILGGGLVIGGVISVNYVVMLCGTVLVSVATLAAN